MVSKAPLTREEVINHHGEIIDQGTHKELIKKGGLYAELYETYFKHQSAEWISEVSRVFKKN